MTFGFLHGVTTQYRDTVPRPVTVVPSSSILLIGAVPTYLLAVADRHINDPILCLSDVDDARFGGAKTPGFNIPYALDAIRDNGGGRVDIVNVYNDTTHRVTVNSTTVTYTFAANAPTVQLRKVTGTAPSQTIVANSIANGVVVTSVTGTSGTPTYVAGTDFTVNSAAGTVTRVPTGTIPAAGSVRINYTYAAPELITASDIIGAVVAGDRTGLQAAYDVYPLRGYRPKLIIAPGYSTLSGVAAEMRVVADRLEAMALLDAPLAATPTEAVAGRAGTAPVGTFQVASRRVMLCYPQVRDTEGLLQPLSAYAAGVIAQTDREFGYWWSPSNKPIRGIIGVERNLTYDGNDNTTEVQVLNAAGICTVANNFGTGFLLMGNRTSLFPSDTTPLNFIPLSRTLDIFHESLQRACFPYLDRPIQDALIDAVLATANGFIDEQVILGALIAGSRAFYNPANNPPISLAAGRIVFSVVLMIPTPAETIVIETQLDINLLSNVGTSEVTT